MATTARVMLALAGLAAAESLDNGMPLPAMGFNTWNHFGLSIDADLVYATIDVMAEELLPFGYDHINLDDGWATHRDAEGNIVVDAAKFPHGLKPLADYAHSKGLKFGIYSDAGNYTCGGQPGSLGYEYQDAQFYAQVGVDFLKYDNCYNEHVGFLDRYETMRDALLSTGRPMYYALCEWGITNVWRWGAGVANSWRTTDDIVDDWLDVIRVADNSRGLARYAGPGAFNDLDMLEVGNGGMNNDEYTAHFAIWAIVKSPLIIGCDVTNMTEETKAILTADEVIAVNQDALGVAGDVVWQEGPLIIYAGPLQDGSRAVVMVNRHTHDNAPESFECVGDRANKPCTSTPADRRWVGENMTVAWDYIGLRPGSKAKVRDLFAKEDLGDFHGSFSGLVRIHGARALKITAYHSDDVLPNWRPWANTQAAAAPPDSDSSHYRRESALIVLALVVLAAAGAFAVLTQFDRRARRSGSSGRGRRSMMLRTANWDEEEPFQSERDRLRGGGAEDSTM